MRETCTILRPNDFRLEQLKEEEWSNLLENSPQRTKYLCPDFLKVFDRNVRFFGLFRKERCLLGLPVTQALVDEESALPFCYYQGLVLGSSMGEGTFTKQQANYLNYLAEALEKVVEQGIEFKLNLHPSLQDIRPFDWLNFGNKMLNRCTLATKYSAGLALKDRSKEDLRGLAQSVRRQEEKYAIERENLSVRFGEDYDNLLKLYCASMSRSGGSVSQDQRRLLLNYCHCLSSATTTILLEVKKETGESVSAAFAWEDFDGYWHLPVVGNSGSRYGGTLLYFALMDEIIDRGGTFLDFNGANSPKRAAYKHSFGAHPIAYYHVSYRVS